MTSRRLSFLLFVLSGIVGVAAGDAAGADLTGLFAARRLRLVQDGRPAISIVFGEQDRATAMVLRDRLGDLLGGAVTTAQDREVLEPGTWRLQAAWAGRGLLLLGNIHTNRAVLPLYSRRLVGAAAGYPGPGRYEIRALFEPLQRGADILFLGASDQAGLEAGVRRLLELVRREAGSGNDGLGPVLELGTESGADAPPRDPVYGEFADAVGAFYWKGNLNGAARAREMLEADLKKRDRGLWFFRQDHYEAERYYRALRQLLAAGVFDDALRGRIVERLLENALENTDPYQIRAMTSDSESVNRGLDRHLLASVLGQYVLLEYLDEIAAAPPAVKAEVHARHQTLLHHIESFIAHRRYQANREGKEGLDCVSALADLYLSFGDERPVREGTFRRMADCYLANCDNLGCQAGQDSYITGMPGEHYAGTSGGLGLLAAAYLHRDGQYRWIAENLKGFSLYWGSRFCARFPPAVLSMPASVPPVRPARALGVSLAPIDPWAYEDLRQRNVAEAIRPITAPPEGLFSKAVFRDGFLPQDAYLLLEGMNLGAQTQSDGYQANAIVRYTELGSLLLFSNTQRETSWSRSVISTSRGGHDPQSAACVLESCLRSPVVSAVRSLVPEDGGVAWRRSVFRRRDGYSVVLDEMTAAAEDDYEFTCRWRSFHPGRIEAARAFQATDGMNGTVLHIVSSDPASLTARLEPRDGAAEPTVVRQRKSARLRAGQGETFQTLLYASSPEVQRGFDIRRASPAVALVKGRGPNLEEVAAFGSGGFALSGLVESDAGLGFVSEQGLAVADARRVALPGRFLCEASDSFHLFLAPDVESGAISNPHGDPVELAFRCEPGISVAIDAKPLEPNAPVRLSPGEHRLAVRPIADLFSQVKADLVRQWDSAGDPLRRAAPPSVSPAEGGWREVWRDPGISPPLGKHRTIRATAEPPTTVGTAADWVDRRVRGKAEESAGWTAGTAGAAVLDLCEEIDIDSLRMIGAMDAFRDGEMEFELVLSRDGFARDRRVLPVARPRFEYHYAEMVQYMWTDQLPTYVLPVGQRARYVKIIARPRGKKVRAAFDEIEVVSSQREPVAAVRLVTGDFLGDGRPMALASSGDQLLMLSRDGKRLWREQLDSTVVCVNTADTNSDGRREILAFTLGEKLYVFNPDGSRRFVHDVRQGKVGGRTVFRPAWAGAWRPDTHGNLEYYFLPHVAYGRISPEPELKQYVTPSMAARGGKFAFTVPDVTTDGREELAVVGGYGLRFSVIDSRSDLAAGKLRYVADRSLHGQSCGNEMLPMFFDGAVVRDAQGRWLGVVAVNPGGVDFFSSPRFTPVWSHFSHVPHTCFTLADLTGDGIPEVLMGREDGFLMAYAIADGRVVARARTDGQIRAVATRGAQVAVGTEGGLWLLNAEFRALGFQPGPVTQLGIFPDDSPGIGRLAVVAEDGTVAGWETAR